MNTPSRWLHGALLAALAGCSADSGLLDAGDPFNIPPADTGRDVPTDRGQDATADVETDTGTDAGTDVAMDGGSADTGVTDTGVADTGVADTGGADTGGADTGVADTGLPDTGPADTGASVDASRPGFGTPVIDGVIGSDWPASAWTANNTVVSAWDPALNALTEVRVAWDATRLYVGLRGVVEDRNAIVLYLDRDFTPGGTATGVTNISTLTDGTGALDDALSCGVTTAPAGFGADLGWGTRGLGSKAATELRDTLGLRDIACPTCRGNFSFLMGDQVACVRGATPACEVAIDWTAVYGASGLPSSPQLALFVRLTNGMGTDLTNNQTLPEQTPPAPTTVTRVLSFAPVR